MHLFIIYLTCDCICRAGEVIKDLLVFTSKKSFFCYNLVSGWLPQVNMIHVR